MNATIQIIKKRRSCRSFAQSEVSDASLNAILEAGQYAPHAGDEAWHFTAIRNTGILERLNLAAKDAARSMALPHLKDLGQNEAFHCLYHAPALIIVSGDDASPIPLQSDCAAAMQNMLIAAESLGLGSCWIFFVLLAFQSPQGSALSQELKIPEGYTPYAAAVFGHKNETPQQTPERKQGVITHIQ